MPADARAEFLQYLHAHRDALHTFSVTVASESRISFYQSEPFVSRSVAHITFARPNRVNFKVVFSEETKLRGAQIRLPFHRFMVSDGKTQWDGNSQFPLFTRTPLDTLTADTRRLLLSDPLLHAGESPLLCDVNRPASDILRGVTHVRRAKDATIQKTMCRVFTLEVPGGQSMFSFGADDKILRRFLTILREHGENTRIEENWTEIRVNPALNAATFRFIPPPGYTEFRAEDSAPPEGIKP